MRAYTYINAYVHLHLSIYTSIYVYTHIHTSISMSIGIYLETGYIFRDGRQTRYIKSIYTNSFVTIVIGCITVMTEEL
jgi:hypothetical protein